MPFKNQNAAKVLVLIGAIWTSGCGSDTSTSSATSTSNSCKLTSNTTETSTANSYGCKLLTRDTSSCKASREAQGLSGYWLKFSCRVTLTKSGANVVIQTDNQPDYKSSYFATTNACYEAFSATGKKTNPNTISTTSSITMTVPYSPTAASATSTMSGGAVGVALNGVVIYDNEAAPGDSIYSEVATFDKCDGHPDSSSRYHYHTEPESITNTDTNFVGVMRDGFPVYGRYHTGSTAPTDLDSAGGHTSTTADSATAVYHYHVNLQTSGTDSAYFLTKGIYKGTAGTCTGCI